MKAPFPWFGGKHYQSGYLLELFPKHHTYCEVFGGSAALLFRKSPSKVEIYNDVNDDLVNFFRVLRSRRKTRKLAWLLRHTPYSRSEFLRLRDVRYIGEVQSAWRFFYITSLAYSGRSMPLSFSAGVVKNYSGCYYNKINRLESYVERIKTVHVECLDWERCIGMYDSDNTLFFLDPPYVPETRRSGEYEYEMLSDDHIRLVDKLLKIKGKVLLCGYDNEIYHRLEKNGWKTMTYEVQCSAAGRTRASGLQGTGIIKKKSQMRQEKVWVNYAPPGQMKLF